MSNTILHRDDEMYEFVLHPALCSYRGATTIRHMRDEPAPLTNVEREYLTTPGNQQRPGAFMVARTSIISILEFDVLSAYGAAREVLMASDDVAIAAEIFQV